MKKTIILIHGLMANAYMMTYMEKQIRKSGHQVYKFNYKSNQYSHETLHDFHQLLQKLDNNPIDIIGHSMGGLVARNYIHHYQPNNIQSIVTIATPHHQSLCAHRVANSMFKKGFGTAGASGLTIDIPEWTYNIPIGCIAGVSQSRLTANLFLPRHDKSAVNDGTVFLNEAILKNCNDHLIMKGSHTGLIFKKEVVRQCLHFLENHNFSK